ncbi:hypothetical protein QQ008_17300 [Fulvivirgaceae bacterium BMA10]|uniref:Alpha/beta hydrolase n=1 Tax=Splendidivirga corallicola TaxID=3051826 RepID=A0ABT8KR05_9BACT|nr:hypothetical protein [Fulvivirgaceae bacterium BMA10]
MKHKQKLAIAFLAFAVLSMSCRSDDNGSPSNPRVFGIFTVQEDGATVLSNGEINTRTLNDFNKMIAAYPKISLINIKEMPGSLDDETNVQIGRKIYNQGINTHLLDNGLIASGGVDFFLAGKKRSLGKNIMIGVHSWSDGKQEATDFPDNSPEHDLFIQYYKDIGFSDQLARDFYFFTIKAASADGIHYMTAAEIDLYQMIRE